VPGSTEAKRAACETFGAVGRSVFLPKQCGTWKVLRRLPVRGGQNNPIPPLAGHDEISLSRAAFGTAQQPRLIENRHPLAVLGDLRGNVGLGSVIAALAPHDQPNLGRERLAQGHRRRLAFFPPALHHENRWTILPTTTSKS
jgi:hypothetical protein